jgi:hypothetical protein
MMMKHAKIAAMAAMLCLGAAAPALAAWDSLGTVTVEAGRGPWNDRGNDRDVRNFDLGGPVERLQLRADGNDVDCRSIRARYGNDRGRGRDNDRDYGRDRGDYGRGGDQIFSGTIRQGRTVDIALQPPRQGRDLDGLVFNCRTMGRRDAVIRISADVGRYQDNWRRGPNWQGTWSRMFNWGSNAVNNWQMVGRQTFRGRNDADTSFVGLRGRHVDAIALMPINADARCSRVEASFDNGRRQTLNLRNGDLLRRGQYTQVDLPGDYRNLDSLFMRCRATDAGSVDIQIYTSH